MMSEALAIDGSRGEGGGQILRTSLSLAALTGRAIELSKIRAGRKKPGLLRQHLTCVQAIARITGGYVQGAELGSSAVSLEPGPVVPGHYRFSVGSAGSASLVFQTVLWPLLFADGPSTVVLEGGTHNDMAPPFPFIERCFLPVLARMGARINVRLDRYGFFPAGGGSFTVDIEPCTKLAALELFDLGPVRARRAVAIVSRLPRHIAERELVVVRERLGILDGQVIETRESSGPGNVLIIELERAGVCEVVTGFGRRGIPAETVASRACDEATRYLDRDRPVGEHLADQLIIPMLLAGGGGFRTGPLTLHTETNIEVVREFLGGDVELDGQTRLNFRSDPRETP